MIKKKSYPAYLIWVVLCVGSCNFHKKNVPPSQAEMNKLMDFHNAFQAGINGGNYINYLSSDRRQVVAFTFLNSPVIHPDQLKELADIVFYEYYQSIPKPEQVKEIRIGFSNDPVHNKKVSAEYDETFVYELDKIILPFRNRHVADDAKYFFEDSAIKPLLETEPDTLENGQQLSAKIYLSGDALRKIAYRKNGGSYSFMRYNLRFPDDTTASDYRPVDMRNDTGFVSARVLDTTLLPGQIKELSFSATVTIAELTGDTTLIVRKQVYLKNGE